jgi:hypothetical protein
LLGNQLAESRGPECHEAVVLLFNAAPISLRSFASTVDVGLVPEGERSFWRATLRKGASWLISAMFSGACFLAASAY